MLHHEVDIQFHCPQKIISVQFFLYKLIITPQHIIVPGTPMQIYKQVFHRLKMEAQLTFLSPFLAFNQFSLLYHGDFSVQI